MPAGTICETPITLVDLFPTFLEIAGMKADPSLDLDGRSLLPQFRGGDGPVLLADGAPRESLYWYFPFPAHMSIAIRKGDWKLVRNFGVKGGTNTEPKVELFRLYNEDGSPCDIGEKNDLAAQEPARRDAMLSELNAFVEKSGAPLPYKNRESMVYSASERKAVPAVLETGSKEDLVWATLESGEGKSAIREAKLLYTLNPAPFDTTRGHREEWFAKPARISDGRVEAEMPPGATHAIFLLLDENRFCVTSEPILPVMSRPKNESPQITSEKLRNAFPWKPGLSALIKLGDQAVTSASSDTTALKKALTAAKKTHSDPKADDTTYANTIRSLRAAIRNQKDTPESQNEFVNRFVFDPKF